MTKRTKSFQQQSNVILKILVIGDSGVGKTNLINRYCQNSFKDAYVATIGIDFKIKKQRFDNYFIRLQIWDTAGQERFKNITNSFYKGAAGILITFSITDQASFQNVSMWIKQINNNASQGVNKVLVGTKTDLEPDRKVTKQQAQTLARKYNMKYFEVSSKTGSNVEEAFRSLVHEIKQRYDEMDEPIFNPNGMQINNKSILSSKTNCSC